MWISKPKYLLPDLIQKAYQTLFCGTKTLGSRDHRTLLRNAPFSSDQLGEKIAIESAQNVLNKTFYTCLISP